MNYFCSNCNGVISISVNSAYHSEPKCNNPKVGNTQ